jgi:hypothetical protein
MNKLSLVGMQLAKKENLRRISAFRAKALRLELLAGIREITWAFIYYECKSDYVTKN